MKTFQKAIFITASVVLCIGLAICIIILGVRGNEPIGSNDYIAADGYEVVTQRVAVADINEIEIDVNNKEIEIIRAPADEIVISYPTSEQTPVEFYNEGGTVTVNQVERVHISFLDLSWFSHWLRGEKMESTVRIELPESYEGSLYLDTSNGAIEATSFDGEGIETFFADSSNGAISISGITAESFELETSNGTIEVQGTMADELHAKTSNGRIYVESSTIKNDVDIKTSNGTVEMTGLHAKTIYAKSSNGKIIVNGIDADDITLDTSNASIRGTILGNEDDYQINSHTSNGDDSLKNRGSDSASKRLDVTTSNGEIDVRFGGAGKQPR